MKTPYIFPNTILEHWNGCQRNWDYSKPVLSEDVDLLVNIARSAPSKNNLNLLSIQVFENSLEKINPILENARTSPNISPKYSVQAPLTIVLGWRIDRYVFLAIENPHHWNELYDRSKDNVHKRTEELSKVTYTYAGVIAGAVSYKANELGYKTGVNTCFMYDTKMIDTDDSVILSIGIGHPLYSKHSDRHKTNDGKNGRGPKNQKYVAPFIHFKNNQIIKDEK
jgi:nitroreductase